MSLQKQFIEVTPTPAEDVANMIMAGRWKLLWLPLPTTYRKIKVARRVVEGEGFDVRGQCLAQHIAADAMLFHMAEVEGYQAITLKSVQDWMARYVGNGAEAWAELLMRRAYTQGFPNTRHNKEWGCVGTRACFSNAYKQKAKPPMLSMTVPFRSCWRLAPKVPFLSPLLVYFVEASVAKYRPERARRKPMPWLYDTIPLERAAIPLAFVLYARAKLQIGVPIDVGFRDLDFTIYFGARWWREYRETLRSLWFDFAFEAFRPREPARIYIETLARALEDPMLVRYW